MNLKKLAYVAMIGTALCLAQSTFAWPDTAFNNGAADGLWSSVGNWSGGMVPGIAPGDTNGSIQIPGGYTVTVQAGETFTCDNVPLYATIFGPEWGSTLNVYGTLRWYWYLAPVGAAGNPSIINLYDNAVVSGEGIGLGYNWWFNFGPYVNLNIRSNAVANINWLYWGGHVNLYGGMLHVTNGVADAAVDLVSDATREMNLSGGMLVLPATFTTTINNWINRGVLFAYGKRYQSGDITINEGDTNYPGQTVVTTTPLGGALQSVHLGARTSMMTGTFQQSPLLGDFPNVTNVVLTFLDPATMPVPTYASSDSSVVSVTAAGLLTALKPGTATIYATSGVFSASSVITVTPYTNFLAHRYSFSESSGSTAADSVGGTAWDGTLYGGASFGGGAVTLDGSSGYVYLPAGVVSNIDAITIEAWVNFGTPAGYAPLYAFGDQNAAASPEGKNYIMFQPFTGISNNPTAAALFGAGDPGYTGEQNAVLPLVSGGVTNLLGGNVYLAVVYHPYAGYVSFYTNGVLAAINSNVSNPLAQTLGNDPLNYLGASLYSVDPFLAATIDEFRIYNGPLTAAQIAAHNALGTEQFIGTSTTVSLGAASAGGGNVALTWPTNSALVTVMASPALGAGANWTQVTGAYTLVNGQYQLLVPATGSVRFFRLQ
jgi:hypothetical protein